MDEAFILFFSTKVSVQLWFIRKYFVNSLQFLTDRQAHKLKYTKLETQPNALKYSFTINQYSTIVYLASAVSQNFETKN